MGDVSLDGFGGDLIVLILSLCALIDCFSWVYKCSKLVGFVCGSCFG